MTDTSQAASLAPTPPDEMLLCAGELVTFHDLTHTRAYRPTQGGTGPQNRFRLEFAPQDIVIEHHGLLTHVPVPGCHDCMAYNRGTSGAYGSKSIICTVY